MGKRKRERCQLVLDAVGKRLIYCKNPATHKLPNGTLLCTAHWRMATAEKRSSG